MKSISIDIPVSSLVWLATCRPEDAASFLRLLLAMSQHPSAPTSAIDLAAIPPTVDWNALVNAGVIACNGKTVSVPGLRKLYEVRKAGRSRAQRARDVRVTCAESTAHVQRTFAASAPSLRPVFSESLPLAPALKRPNQSAKSERSEKESAPDALADLGARARALLTEKARDWRRKKSLAMIEDAIARWSRDGFTSCPIDKAFEVVESESALPARVEHLIQSADAMLAKFKASGGRRPNPVGFLFSGLGLSGNGHRKPCKVPPLLADRWAKAEAESLRATEAMAAVQSKINAMRDSKGVIA